MPEKKYPCEKFLNELAKAMLCGLVSGGILTFLVVLFHWLR